MAGDLLITRDSWGSARFSHQIFHVEGGEVCKPSGEHYFRPPEVSKTCSFCNPSGFRWRRFLLRLRVNPKYAMHALFEEF